ncbi:MAG: hypothetical protein ACK4E4_05010 [Rhodocyclaceae bacterium]
MPRFLLALMSVLLAGCVGSPPRQTMIVRHDLGDPSGRWLERAIVIREVEVRAAPWLDTPAQFYRRVDTAPLQRQRYAASRWEAAPSEMLERWLARLILPEQPAGEAGGGCHLVIWLDELEQRFTSPRSSEVVLAARAGLLRGKRILAQKALRIVRPAPSPDSSGGVEATRAAVHGVAEALEQWLGERRQLEPELVSVCAGR